MRHGFSFNEKDGVLTLSVPSFDETGLCLSAFTTRLGGVSKPPLATMNLGFGRGDERDAVLENYKILGKALGFTDADLLCSELYVNVYRMPERTAFEAAKCFAKQLKPLCQDGVQFYGDPERRVSSVAVGTGCYCDPIELMELGADMYIAIDDTVRTWIQAPYSTDSGLPMIVIHHGTSEEPGVQMLCEHLKTVLTQPVEHFLCGCGYKWISAE